MEQKTENQIDELEWPYENEGWFQNLTSLEGRYRRREFLVGLLISIGVSLIPVISWFSIIILLAVTSKRLHDIDLSGKWIFLIALLHIGCLIGFYMIENAASNALVVWTLGIDLPVCIICLLLLIWPGTKGINRFGTNPRRSYREQCLEAGYPEELLND